MRPRLKVASAVTPLLTTLPIANLTLSATEFRGSLNIYFVVVFAGRAFALIAVASDGCLAGETLGQRSVPIQMSHKRKYKA